MRSEISDKEPIDEMVDSLKNIKIFSGQVTVYPLKLYVEKSLVRSTVQK